MTVNLENVNLSIVFAVCIRSCTFCGTSCSLCWGTSTSFSSLLTCWMWPSASRHCAPSYSLSHTMANRYALAPKLIFSRWGMFYAPIACCSKQVWFYTYAFFFFLFFDWILFLYRPLHTLVIKYIHPGTLSPVQLVMLCGNQQFLCLFLTDSPHRLVTCYK